MSEKTAEAPATASTPSKPVENADATLGSILSVARERSGSTRPAAAQKTRIPEHYLKMLESSDYSKISDQLYLVPFLRRYATFLELDPEEMAIRFVRDVQRADSTPPGVRMAEPLIGERRKRARIGPAAGMVALVAVVIGAFLLMQRHRENSAGLPVPAAGASAFPSRAGN